MLALMAVAPSFAQSTGSQTIEDQSILVTGSNMSKGVGGVVMPNVPKTRFTLNQDMISHQLDGQTIANALNQIPGVNFTNTDPYGASGGNIRVRGFPGNRVSLLFDGLPLNDTGNYSMYTNQQLDPEIIDHVSVNLGTTDVDSPTPSAAGGVISYTSLVPSEKFGVQLKGTAGSWDFQRIFGMVQTGTFTKYGTRAYFAVSDQQYDKFTNGATGARGKLHRTQFNARIYQPLGSNGDFISIAGHYNRNRNASYNSGLASDFATNKNFDNIAKCVLAPARADQPDDDNAGSTTNITTPASCTNYYGLRINPSNTGNIRGSSRFTLSDKLTLTIDPGYQYTKANGGGTGLLLETDARLRGPKNVVGVDLNGDGDTLDNLRVYTPSNTRTNRFTLLSSLIYELNPNNRLRLAYTFDYGRHRQTGEYGRIDDNGNPLSVWGGLGNSAAIYGADGNKIQGRNRKSIAMLNQISGEYFGRFFDDKIEVTAGVRAPFFHRELNQYCFTQVSSGNVTCTTQTLPATGATIVPANYAGNGTSAAGNLYYAPFSKTANYHPVLPSAGITWNIAGPHSVYGSYGRNFSAPSTDNLYRSPVVNPKGETTDAFEGGYRYRSGKIQGQIAGYYTIYKNRIVSSTDADPASPTFGTSIDRNVGSARSYGFDAQIGWKPVNQFTLTPFVSYIHSRLKDNIVDSKGAITVQTKGAQFAETPKWQFGGRAQLDVQEFSFGAEFKHVGGRFATDDNGQTHVTPSNSASAVAVLSGFAGAPIDANGRLHGYTTVDLDARMNLSRLGMDKTYLAFGVTNLTNAYYFGNITTQSTLSGNPRFRIGSPRTFQGTVNFAF
jgi:iron complex outermembrane receptor protein